MKRALFSIATLLVCSAASAQLNEQVTLKTYVAKALPRCPGGALTLEPKAGGPANFTAYTATLRSSDEYCGTQKILLYSPKTQQILLGSVISLPADTRPAEIRISEEASKLLQKPMKATVSPFPLQDGIKAVAISRDTPFGPFSYNGFLDASQQFLIVGSRGSLKTDPAVTLREALGVKSAGARRGAPNAKAEIIEISDFQCPTCARAHEMVEPIIRKNLPKMSYTRLDLPLFEHHEWALQAAMAARAINRVAPTKYWDYVDYIFKNQEQIGKQPFETFLQGYLEDHDIDAAAIKKIYVSKTERQALLDQVSRAFAVGVASTPTFIVNGQIMGFGPEGTFTIAAIKNAVGDKTPTPAKKSGK
jgi:protein-disulfide isomerase